MWIDFRGIQDEVMRAKGIDSIENSRRATYVQQQYAIQILELQRVRGELLEDHGERWSGTGLSRDRRRRAMLRGLHDARDSLRPG